MVLYKVFVFCFDWKSSAESRGPKVPRNGFFLFLYVENLFLTTCKFDVLSLWSLYSILLVKLPICAKRVERKFWSTFFENNEKILRRRIITDCIEYLTAMCFR